MTNITDYVISSPEYLNSLTTISTLILCLSFYSLGLVSVLLNFYVFSQPDFRLNPCCIFLSTLNFIDLIHIHTGLLTRMIQSGLQWNILNSFPIICRMRYYISYTIVTLYMILLNLAAFERYASTCNLHSHWRRFSKPIFVYYTLFTSIFISCFISLPAFFCYYINATSVCTPYTGACTKFAGLYMLIIGGCISTLFTTFFSCLTMHNLHIIHRRARAAPISYKIYLHIKDANEQLTSMLFMQTTVTLVSALPVVFFMIYQLATHHVNKTPLWIAWDKLIAHLVQLLTYGNFISSAYINLVASPTYRHHLICKVKSSLGRHEIHHKFPPTLLLSVGRVGDLAMFFSNHVNSSEAVEQKQLPQEQHNLQIKWQNKKLSKLESVDVVINLINESQGDNV